MPKSLAESLDAMALAHSSKSQTARLREVFSKVEAALQSGVSRKAVLEALNKDGFTFNMQSFEKALYRIRKSISKGPNESATTIKQESAFLSPAESQSVQRARTINNPSDIRKHREEILKNTDWLALSKPVTKQP